MLLAATVAAAVTATTTSGTARTTGAGRLPSAAATVTVATTFAFAVLPKFTSPTAATAILPFAAATTTALLLRLAAAVTTTATLPGIARRHGCRCGRRRLVADVLAGRRHEIGSPRPVGFLSAGTLFGASAVIRAALRLGATLRTVVAVFRRK